MNITAKFSILVSEGKYLVTSFAFMERFSHWATLNFLANPLFTSYCIYPFIFLEDNAYQARS